MYHVVLTSLCNMWVPMYLKVLENIVYILKGQILTACETCYRLEDDKPVMNRASVPESE